MKALVITYYWPPAGGSGVQRWLKFVKYLRDFDIEPVVVTVQDPHYALTDLQLENEVPETVEIVRLPIWEPNTILHFFGRNSKKTSAGFLNPNPSFFGRIAQYIRANFFIPDARKFWIKPSVKYLVDYLQNNAIDVIITTGPPHSTHMIGLKLKEKLAIKWIADFRDPWTEIDYFHRLPLTKKAIEKHRILEKSVLKKADTVIAVGQTMASNFKKFATKVAVITNGYDTLEFSKTTPVDATFSIVHIGLMNADRNHEILWKTLHDLCVEYPSFKKDLRLKLIGSVAHEVQRDIHKYQLDEYTELISYVPHAEVQHYQRTARVLLLTVNNVPNAKGIITGKVFEYLLAKRPILALAPTDGDLNEIIERTKAGVVVGFDDEKTLKKELLNLYSDFNNNSVSVASKNIEQYHRKELTKKLAAIIKDVVE